MQGAVSHCFLPSTKISTRLTFPPFASVTLTAIRPVWGMTMIARPTTTAATTTTVPISPTRLAGGRTSCVSCIRGDDIELTGGRTGSAPTPFTRACAELPPGIPIGVVRTCGGIEGGGAEAPARGANDGGGGTAEELRAKALSDGDGGGGGTREEGG